MSEKKDNNSDSNTYTIKVDDPSSTIGPIDWSTGSTITVDRFNWIDFNVKDIDTCSKCKKEEEVYTRYNWSENVKLNRIICKKCHTKTMDKLYGLDKNIDTEITLFEKKKNR